MRLVCLVTLIGLCSTRLEAVELSGRVELVSNGRPLRSEEAVEAVVYFRPTGPVATAPMPVQVMSTRRKRFMPRVMAITVGTRVDFPNNDPILHNAFSTSRGNGFDIGLLGEGETAAVRFDSPGYVRVYCNVHHAMAGHILVLDTPHFMHPDSSGHFHLRGLPDVPGEVVVWHDHARPWRRQVSTPAELGTLQVRLDLERRRVPPHLNKFGRPYGRDSDGGY